MTSQTTTERKTLPITSIRRDANTQVRAKLDQATVKSYADVLDRLPPVTVFEIEPDAYTLADGFHRVAAFEAKGIKEIEAEVRAGTLDDAREYAAIANTRAGKPLSAQDRASAVRMLADIHPTKGQVELADMLSMSPSFVSRMLGVFAERRAQPDIANLPDASIAEALPIKDVNLRHRLLAHATTEGWTGAEIRDGAKVMRSGDKGAIDKMLSRRGPAPKVRASKDGPIQSIDWQARRDGRDANEPSIWTIYPDDTVKAVRTVSKDVNLAEKRLEEMLVQNPDMLEPDIQIVGRQTPTDGGPSDLLGVDRHGRLVVFELKRDSVTRDAVTQCIDYASALDAMDPDEELAKHIAEHSGTHGIKKIADFKAWYREQYEEQFAESELRGLLPPRLVLVGLGVDDRAKRIARFLRARGVDISVMTFRLLQHGSETLLDRRVEVG